MLVWIGSILALAVSSGMGFFQLEGLDRVFLIGACVVYILGVMLPTAMINIPLNNALQKNDIESMSNAELRAFRTGLSRPGIVGTLFGQSSQPRQPWRFWLCSFGYEKDVSSATSG